jgi:hypothetical protein
MENVHDLISRIGRDRFTAETGFSPQVISRAIGDNLMPSGWFLAVDEICRRDGIETPRHLFRWADRRSKSGAA